MSWEVLTDDEPTESERDAAEHLLEVLASAGAMYGSSLVADDPDAEPFLLIALRVTDIVEVAVSVRGGDETVAMTREIEG